MNISDTASDLERIRNAATNRSAALGDELAVYRDRLKLVVCLRMDHRVQGRVDPSDVIQDTFLEACRRIDDYLADPSVSFFVWLRFLAKQRLAMIHRQHLRVQARDARRDVPLYDSGFNSVSAAALAAQLAARLTSPSMKLHKVEWKVRIQNALDQLDANSREILELRHFEQLSNSESAEVLGLSPTAACNRYVRALERLKLALGPVMDQP